MHFLKWLFLWGTIFLVTSSVAQTEVSHLTISIELSRSVVKAGSDVALNVLMTNTSNIELPLMRSLPKNQGKCCSRIEIRNDKNELMRRKPQLTTDGKGKIFLNLSGGSVVGFTVQPGENLQDKIFLSRLYDLSQSGKYTIQMEQTDSISKALVKSTTVSLTVTP